MQSETNGDMSDIKGDIFLDTLWDIVHKEITFIKTQMPRIRKLWKEKLGGFGDLPGNIPEFKADKDLFYKDDHYKIKILDALAESMREGYNLVKNIISFFFGKFFRDETVISDKIGRNNLIPISYMTAEKLVGSLLQLIYAEKNLIPAKYVLTAKNRALLKLKWITDVRLAQSLKSVGIDVTAGDVDTMLSELVDAGYIERREANDSEKSGYPGAVYAYRWKTDFLLDEKALGYYNSVINPIVDWAVGLWRSMFNIRELNVDIPDKYKWKNILEKIVSKAATQGFRTSYWVIENLKKYYMHLVRSGLNGN